jgi:hypothetical protein
MILVSDASQYIAQNGADALFVAYFKTNDPAVVKAKYDVSSRFMDLMLSLSSYNV